MVDLFDSVARWNAAGRSADATAQYERELGQLVRERANIASKVARVHPKSNPRATKGKTRATPKDGPRERL